WCLKYSTCRRRFSACALDLYGPPRFLPFSERTLYPPLTFRIMMLSLLRLVKTASTYPMSQDANSAHACERIRNERWVRIIIGEDSSGASMRARTANFSRILRRGVFVAAIFSLATLTGLLSPARLAAQTPAGSAEPDTESLF